MEKKVTSVHKKITSTTKKDSPSVVNTVSLLDKYIEAIGRRKSSIARVRLYPGRKEKKVEVIVNEKSFRSYFLLEKHQRIVISPLSTFEENIYATVVVKGGGVNAQAEAIRLGIARALVAITPSYRSKLKSLDYLKRDPRMVERKKFGNRKARRPQQWRKR